MFQQTDFVVLIHYGQKQVYYQILDDEEKDDKNNKNVGVLGVQK